MPTSLRRSATNAICRRQIQPHPNAATGPEQCTRLDRLLTHTIVCLANRTSTTHKGHRCSSLRRANSPRYVVEWRSLRRGRRPRRPARSAAATGSEQRTRLDRPAGDCLLRKRRADSPRYDMERHSPRRGRSYPARGERPGVRQRTQFAGGKSNRTPTL